MGAVSIVWYIGLTFIPNTDILTDSVIATAFGIAFYYALTGFACVVFYRRELRKNIKNFVSSASCRRWAASSCSRCSSWLAKLRQTGPG